jgi:hypothetical protein
VSTRAAEARSGRPRARVLTCDREGITSSQSLPAGPATVPEADAAATVTPDELTEVLDQTFQLMCAAERRFLDAVRQFTERELYEGDGARTMVDWLTFRYSVSRERATGYVRVATGLPALPALSSAYEDGRLGVDQLSALVRVATPDNDQALVDAAEGRSVSHSRAIAARITRLSRDEANDVHAIRFLQLLQRGNRMVLRGELTSEDGAVVEQALLGLAQKAPKDLITGQFTSLEQRLADALVQACSQALGAEQDRDPDIPGVVCHIDARTLAGVDGEAELEGGAQLAIETVERILCDCRFQIVKENEHGEAIGLGRLTRTIPRWLRRQLTFRDGGCRFPGCERLRWADGHHIIHWAKGGPTDPDNLISLCRHHHRLVHERGWAIVGDPAGEVAFRAPDGRELRSKPAPTGAREDVLRRFGLWPPGRGSPHDLE